MKNVDLKYICTAIGNLSGIPVRLFRDGELVLNHSVARLPKDPHVPVPGADLCGYSEHRLFHHAPFQLLRYHQFGQVQNRGGATRQLVHNSQDLRTLAFRMDIPQDEVTEFMAGMQSIVRMPLESVMQMLCVVNYVLNGEKVELEDITIYDNEQQYLRREMVEQTMGYQPDTAPEHVHNSLPVEQIIENIIRTGDTACLKEWMASAPAVRPGVIAGDQLRQSKNLFVVTATLASREAIRGGMEAEDALSLSDAFIQKCELLDSMERITNLQYRMILEFTEQVEKLQWGANGSELTVKVTNYIQRHVFQPVTAEVLAKHLYLSRPYLSVRFKAETGNPSYNSRTSVQSLYESRNFPCIAAAVSRRRT